MSENEDKFSYSAFPEDLFDLLAGNWQGEGNGFFPTIDSFAYLETLTFERLGASTLFYMQRTKRRKEAEGPFVNSHWESGFIQAQETGVLELANVQSGGRGEVLAGTLEWERGVLRLLFTSTAVTNDERMVGTTRVFELDGDVLRYEMGMATNRVREITPHVAAVLQRV